MCELAFNIHGERFEPPAEAMGWRVRRLKPGGRGMPDVVFGEDGAPLMIDMDTALGEFRRLVGGEPGRYRLDPIDENNNSVDGGAPAYLHIRSAMEGSSAGAPAPAATSAELEVIRELVRVNSEMVRNITDKFAAVMDSAATLIRAADGAGMPARTPLAMEPAQAGPATSVVEDDDPDEDDEDDELAPIRNSPTAEIGEIVRDVKEIVQTIMHRPPQAALAPPRNAAPADDFEDDELDDEECVDEAPAPLPPLTPQQMTQLMAVRARLTAEEQRLLEEVAKELPPEELQAWMHRLSQLSVAGAVSLIRETMAGTAAGGAS